MSLREPSAFANPRLLHDGGCEETRGQTFEERGFRTLLVVAGEPRA